MIGIVPSIRSFGVTQQQSGGQEKDLHDQAPDLTPQESEQLSQYASDDNYVQKQKDIQELTSLFRSRMSDTKQDIGSRSVYGSVPREVSSQRGYKASYSITVTDKPNRSEPYC